MSKSQLPSKEVILHMEFEDESLNVSVLTVEVQSE
jgi:hypothetical protein